MAVISHHLQRVVSGIYLRVTYEIQLLDSRLPTGALAPGVHGTARMRLLVLKQF